MSNGPISIWWRSYRPVTVSTPDAHRRCIPSTEPGRGYCGRSPKQFAKTPSDVNCSDCVAAVRADKAAAQ